MEDDIKFCLDSNIIIKFLVKEKDSFKADRLLERIVEEKIKLIEPTFLKIEVYSVLRKKSYFKEFTELQIKKAFSIFKRLKLEYILEDIRLLDSAYRLAEKLKEPVVYDSLYLALAKKEKAIFITADKRFFNKAELIYKKSFLLGQMKNLSRE